MQGRKNMRADAQMCNEREPNAFSNHAQCSRLLTCLYMRVGRRASAKAPLPPSQFLSIRALYLSYPLFVNAYSPCSSFSLSFAMGSGKTCGNREALRTSALQDFGIYLRVLGCKETRRRKWQFNSNQILALISV